MHVAGMPAERRRQAHWPRGAARDAEVVARLRRAGAVVVGLTNLHEFAYGITSDNPHFGRVVNPAAPERIPGRVERRIGRRHRGGHRDGGGRHRHGAARSASPRRAAASSASSRATTRCRATGVLDLARFARPRRARWARTVDDCAAHVRRDARPDANAAWALRRACPAAGRQAQRILRPSPSTARCAAALDEAMAGARARRRRCVDARDRGRGARARDPAQDDLSPRRRAVHAERLRERGHVFGEDVRVRIEIGQFIPGHWYAKAQRMRGRARRCASMPRSRGRTSSSVPTLRTPAPAVGAARVAHRRQATSRCTRRSRNSRMPFNLSGLPAISIPWTTSADGVPICAPGGRPRAAHDWRVLAVARRLEAHRRGAPAGAR